MTAGARPVLGLLTAAFFLRGLFFALALPYGDPLDELFHYGYAAFLAETGRAPRAAEQSLSAEVFRPFGLLARSTSFPGPKVSWREWASLSDGDRSERSRAAFAWKDDERRLFVAPNYEAQQPPLTYLLARPVLAMLGRAPLDRRLLALRVLSVLLASAVVPLAYGFLRRVLPKPSALAATGALVAFPGLGPFVGRFTNDGLALPIVAALLLILADLARGRLPWSRAAVLAGLLAAGCWTKLYVLLLLPAAPLTALLCRQARRAGVVRRATVAALLAFLAFVPWLWRQHADTGDWWGLTSTKEAARLGVGLAERLQGLPDLATLRFTVVFGRTFLWPGTWSAAGAPAALAVVLSLALLLLAMPGTGNVSRQRGRAWRAGGVALALFALGHLAYATTILAVSRAQGRPASAGPDGWYLLVLLPVILTAGSAAGRAVPARRFLAAGVVFLAADWWLTMGVLPAVYAGQTVVNGANAPFSAYAATLASPAGALASFAAVCPSGAPAAWLGVLLAAWLLTLGAGLLRVFASSV